MSYVRMYSAPRNSQLRGKLSQKDNYVCVHCLFSETALETLQFLWVPLLSHEFPYFKSSSFLFSHFSVWNQGHELSVLFLRWPRRFSRKWDSSFLTHSLSEFHWLLSSELMPRHMVPTLKEAYASFLLEAASSLMAVRQLSVREPILPSS